MTPRQAGSGGRVSSGRLFDHLLVALGVAAVSGVVLTVVANQQAFLDFYYLPVAFAAWRLGRRSGVLAAIAAAALVFWTAAANEAQFAHLGAEPWMRWIDLIVWAGFLFLTATAVGTLAERDESRIAQLQMAYRGILEIMAKFIDSIDRSTEDHSRRVADRAVELARELGLDEDAIESIRVAAYLHDIGKVEVSAEVLHKAARLSPDEHAEMRRHVEYGTALLERVGGLLEHVVPIVRHHHERWDGKGYHGLAGADIPIGARIIAVADTYDAIIADRPYREGRPHQEAIEILRRESGTQFDPEVVAAFLRLFEDLPAERETAAA